MIKSVYQTEDSHSFRTIIRNEISIQIEHRMYVVRYEEKETVPERKYVQYIVQRLKPSQLLYHDDLDPEEEYFVFKHLTFRYFTAPLLDSHVKNINTMTIVASIS